MNSEIYNLGDEDKLLESLHTLDHDSLLACCRNLPDAKAVLLMGAYIELHPKSLPIMMALSDCYERLRDERAVEIYNRVIESFPGYGSGYTSCARAYESRRKFDAALEVLARGLPYLSHFGDSEFYAFAFRYCNNLLRQPLMQRNLAVFEMFAERFPNDERAVALHRLRFTAFPILKTAEEAFQQIDSRLASFEPFSVARAGNIEVVAILNNKFTSSLKNNAGICEPDKNVAEESWRLWSSKYNKCLATADFHFVVPLTEHYGGNYGSLIGSSPENAYHYPSETRLHFWLSLLAKATHLGGTVIISQFSKSIRKAIENLDAIHNNNYNFNTSNLILVQAPVTLADEPSVSWQRGFDDVCAQLDQLDYRYAFLGCGGYGLPLVDSIKSSGKVAIYVGGHIQLLFGIWGRRWTDQFFRSEFMNNLWLTPDVSEVPVGAEKVEGGCYWVP